MVLGPAHGLEALALLGAGLGDILRDRRGPDEGNRLDIVIVEQRVDGRLVAMHDLQDTFRKASLDHQFGQTHRH